jgi:hypothetical protein
MLNKICTWTAKSAPSTSLRSPGHVSPAGWLLAKIAHRAIFTRSALLLPGRYGYLQIHLIDNDRKTNREKKEKDKGIS